VCCFGRGAASTSSAHCSQHFQQHTRLALVDALVDDQDVAAALRLKAWINWRWESRPKTRSSFAPQFVYGAGDGENHEAARELNGSRHFSSDGVFGDRDDPTD